MINIYTPYGSNILTTALSHETGSVMLKAILGTIRTSGIHIASHLASPKNLLNGDIMLFFKDTGLDFTLVCVILIQGSERLVDAKTYGFGMFTETHIYPDVDFVFEFPAVAYTI